MEIWLKIRSPPCCSLAQIKIRAGSLEVPRAHNDNFLPPQMLLPGAAVTFPLLHVLCRLTHAVEKTKVTASNTTVSKRYNQNPLTMRSPVAELSALSGWIRFELKTDCSVNYQTRYSMTLRRSETYRHKRSWKINHGDIGENLNYL